MLIFIKMNRELKKIIKIPEGVNVTINDAEVTATLGNKKNSRDFDLMNLSLEKKDNEIILGEKKSSKKDKRRMNTIASHIANLIQGVQTPYEYKLKICFSHFPITVEIKGKHAIIKNFLGERSPRKIEIPAGADIKIEKEIITVIASDKEVAGQAAANLENITRIPNRDRRIFQDGIFITNKNGEEI